MKNRIFSFFISYIALALYFNLLPLLFQMSDVIYFFHMLLFFPVAYLVAKLLNKTGFESYGIIFFKGWQRNMSLGFLIGFSTWALLFLLRFVLHEYEWTGIKSGISSVGVLIVVIVGYGLGSFISDMIVRGLVFYHFKDKVSFLYIMLIAIILYAADDMWREGFSVQNTIFSCALGLSLTYSFYKTNSIWASAGIHFGLNMAYGLFFGVSGHIGDGIFLFQAHSNDSFLHMWLSTILACVMFLFVYICIPRFKSIQMKH